MALTKNCWSNAGKVSWRRTTYHGVPDQDHAPSNSPKNIMGEKGIKERGISEESCVKRNVPTSPGRRRDSDAVRNERHGRRLYISAVCLESPARYYKILRIFLSLVTRNGLDRSGIRNRSACSFWNGDGWNVCLRADGNYP